MSTQVQESHKAQFHAAHVAARQRMGMKPVTAAAVVKRSRSIKPPPVVKRDILYVQTLAFDTRITGIRDAVLEAFGVSKVEFLSSRRFNYICRARQVFYWLAKQRTSLSLPSIGRFAGGKDHTTVIHGIRVIETNMEEFKPVIDAVLARLEGRGKA